MTGDEKKKIIIDEANSAYNYYPELKVPDQIKAAVEKQEKIHPEDVPYYRFFYYLASELKPNLCVELGTNRGVAAACLALGNPDGYVVTLDVEIKEHFEGCGLPNVEYFECNSMAPIVNFSKKTIDILFIDTSSKGSKNLAEFMHWLPYLKPGGIIFIDDIFITADHKGPIPHDDRMRDMWEGNGLSEYGEQIILPLHGDNGFGAVLLHEKEINNKT